MAPISVSKNGMSSIRSDDLGHSKNLASASVIVETERRDVVEEDIL